ncbi:hypothetical protein V8C42DRAFT_269237 [Trichoderma barbatum]
MTKREYTEDKPKHRHSTVKQSNFTSPHKGINNKAWDLFSKRVKPTSCHYPLPPYLSPIPGIHPCRPLSNAQGRNESATKVSSPSVCSDTAVKHDSNLLLDQHVLNRITTAQIYEQHGIYLAETLVALSAGLSPLLSCKRRPSQEQWRLFLSCQGLVRYHILDQGTKHLSGKGGILLFVLVHTFKRQRNHAKTSRYRNTAPHEIQQNPDRSNSHAKAVF